MTLGGAQLDILWPAFVAGLIVTATHVPLGVQVLERGIVFIDLAIAQIAALGVILADYLGWGTSGLVVQAAALCAALAGAAFLRWTERRWPEVQEAIIGVVFVVCSSVAILLLAHNPHGGESLKDLLSGQILWVTPAQLGAGAVVSLAIGSVWFAVRRNAGRTGFYGLFACAVTLSVQLVGLLLVFASLVVPALATYYARRNRYARAYAVSVAGYATGLLVSLAADLPSGATIVCAMALTGALAALAFRVPRPHP
jgi:zinc/manganese transport system permease protein